MSGSVMSRASCTSAASVHPHSRARVSHWYRERYSVRAALIDATECVWNHDTRCLDSLHSNYFRLSDLSCVYRITTHRTLMPKTTSWASRRQGMESQH